MSGEHGEVTVLTGASRGIGRLLALELARRGARLVLAARGREALEAVCAEIVEAGGEAIAVVTDVSVQADLDALIDEAERVFGPVDVLINNAGIEKAQLFESLSLEDLDRYLAVNLRSVMALALRVLPGMIERDRGHILNMGSLAGLGPVAFGEAYGATKHGVVGLTRAMRASLQRRGSAVTASVVCPGYVRDVGMFHRKQQAFGVQVARILGVVGPDEVVTACMKALDRDLPEVVVNPGPTKLFLALALLAPRLMERFTLWAGVHDVGYEAAIALDDTSSS
jgi:short-subunit dehydrogenase